MSTNQDEQPVPFIYIPRGWGPVIDIPHDTASSQEAISKVGTLGCYTSVGVYIPLTTTKCFVAHIVAVTVDETGSVVVSGQQGEKLEENIKWQLRNLIGRDWPPDPRMRQRALVVCICTVEETGAADTLAESKSYAGRHIVKAVSEYLEVSEGLIYKGGKGGFVVDHETKERDVFDDDRIHDGLRPGSPTRDGYEKITLDASQVWSWKVRWSVYGQWMLAKLD